MVLQERHRKIIVEMTKISQSYIKSYFTDFTSFDIPQLCELVRDVNFGCDRYTAAGMLWCIRDTGTHLLFPEFGKNIDHFPDIVNMNDRYFYINLENKTQFQEIRYSEAMEIVKDWKEITEMDDFTYLQ